MFRQQKHWTQEQLANKLNMSPNGYGDIERGMLDITWSRLEQIAQLFEMDVLDLIGFNDKNIFHIRNTFGSGHHWDIATTGNQNQLQLDFHEKLQLINLQLEREVVYLKQEMNIERKL
ncbi:MAG: helix-turn-helix transcriptional regulator [Thiotrichaceae bacterium]